MSVRWQSHCHEDICKPERPGCNLSTMELWASVTGSFCCCFIVIFVLYLEYFCTHQCKMHYCLMYIAVIPSNGNVVLCSDGHTRGHSLLCKPGCHNNIRKYFFSIVIINKRNCLTDVFLQLLSVNSLKWYDTIWYNTGSLTCSKKLMCSWLSLPHGTDRKIKEKNYK